MYFKYRSNRPCVHYYTTTRQTRPFSVNGESPLAEQDLSINSSDEQCYSLFVSLYAYGESGTTQAVFNLELPTFSNRLALPVLSDLLYATRPQKLVIAKRDIVLRCQRSSKKLTRGWAKKPLKNPFRREEVAEPVRGLVYVDLSESQACIGCRGGQIEASQARRMTAAVK